MFKVLWGLERSLITEMGFEGKLRGWGGYWLVEHWKQSAVKHKTQGKGMGPGRTTASIISLTRQLFLWNAWDWCRYASLGFLIHFGSCLVCKILASSSEVSLWKREVQTVLFFGIWKMIWQKWQIVHTSIFFLQRKALTENKGASQTVVCSKDTEPGRPRWCLQRRRWPNTAIIHRIDSLWVDESSQVALFGNSTLLKYNVLKWVSVHCIFHIHVPIQSFPL